MMTDREILIELLAIKLFEHDRLGDGSPHRLSWIDADPEDRQGARDAIKNRIAAEDLYSDEP